jgi:tripartite-type tricarboxylate transporter receptor subunit TctC
MVRRFASAVAASCLLAAGSFAPSAARAQTPVTIITSFGSASAADIVARLLAAEFTPVLGVPVVVKNTTGAAGTIAASEAVRARPDGNTLLFSPIGPIAIQPNSMRNAGYQPTDVEPVCMVNKAPLIMMTPPDSGLRTVADVAARARAQNGQMAYGTTGVGTTPHLSMVMWAKAAGVGLSHITYRGPADVMVAFQQGSVLLMNDHPSSVRANGLHPIAVLAAERLSDFPDTPTMREAGFPMEMAIWHGLFAPKGTPAPIIARFESACERAAKAPAVIQGHERIQTPVVYRGAREFGQEVARDVDIMKRIIDENGLRQAE